MFILDFTKPYMYANTIAFYQGNLSTNNTLRCKLKTGSVEDLTGFACTATFYVNGVEIVETCKIIDRASCIVDVVLPSNALVAGEHKMEVILTKPNVSTIQSPMLKYEVWQGLTTGEGIEGTVEYPILVELINNTQQAIDKTNELQTEVKASLVLANEEIDKIPGKVQQKVDEITSNIDPLIQDMEKNEEIRQANEAERIKEEAIRKASEKARIDAELVREHNDADHEKAEAVRETSEEARRVAEERRVEAEALRVKAESDRVVAEDKRVQAENERQENYNFMTGDEERRRLEENKRIEAEKVRVASETERISEESKRRTVEASRVKAEETRVSSENTRMANEETRKTQETQRVQAETNRSTKYDKLIQDTNASIEEFHTFTTQAKTDETTRKRNETNRLNAERERREAETAREASESVRNRQEDIRVVRDENRENVFNGKVRAIDAKIAEGAAKISEVDTAKNTMVNDTKQAIDKMKKDFSALTASQQQDAEVITARDGEESLNGRLERDLFIEGKSLKQEVLDLGGLKENQDMAYDTDKGYLVCKETKNGVIKDLEISGKSLVNLWSLDSVEKASSNITIDNGYIKTVANGTYLTPSSKNIETVKPSTYYTVIFEVSKNTCNGTISLNVDHKDESCFSKNESIEGGRTGVFAFKMQSKPILTSSKFLVRTQVQASCTSGEFVYRCIVVEGDYTQNLPNGYFEGITSVGSGVDKIEVSSVKADGNILTTQEVFKATQSDVVINGGDFSIISKQENTLGYITLKNMKVEKNTKYYIKCDGLIAPQFSRINITDGGTNELFDKTGNVDTEYYEFTTNDSGIIFISLYANNGKKPASTTVYKNLRLVKKQQEYQPYKEDKKPILFKDADGTWKPIKELRGLSTICDTVELHSDGKYYYHQRTATKTLTGAPGEDWRRLSSLDTGNTERYALYLNDIYANGEMLSNQFMYIKQGGNDMSTCIYIHNTDKRIDIRKLKTDKRWTDLSSYKEWLQTNNLIIVYQSAEEKVFEANPLFLDAYEGETLIQILSGAISPEVTFKITSYINNLVMANVRRIKELENEVFKGQEAQNQVILENDLRIIELEMALMDSMPTLYIRLGGEDMQERSQLYFDFLVGRIESGNYTDEYLERVINKYLQGKRITQDEYDILYDMIYPPVYDLPQE